MRGKKIEKEILDNLIVAARNVCNNDYSNEKETKKALGALREARKPFPYKMSDIDTFVFSIIHKYRGLKPTATNEDIYRALECFGYEVSDGVEIAE